MFDNTRLAELTADDIEMYHRGRLKQHVMMKAKDGFVKKVTKAASVCCQGD